MTIQVTITASGRLSLPADMRRRLGLSEGGAVFLEETDDGVVLRTAAQAVAHAQAMSRQLIANKDQTSVADFLTSRGAWQE